MFIHEGILLQENGKWCLEFNDSKKYFTPGKIAKVMAPDCESDFTYQDDTVTCICRKNGEIISEIIYKNNGAPVSGKVYMNGKAIKKFEYDELGQVAKEYEL
jgi:hypothetical protein